VKHNSTGTVYVNLFVYEWNERTYFCTGLKITHLLFLGESAGAIQQVERRRSCVAWNHILIANTLLASVKSEAKAHSVWKTALQILSRPTVERAHVRHRQQHCRSTTSSLRKTTSKHSHTPNSCVCLRENQSIAERVCAQRGTETLHVCVLATIVMEA